MFCIALVPVNLTHATPPTLTVAPRLTFRDLRRLAVSLSYGGFRFSKQSLLRSRSRLCAVAGNRGTLDRALSRPRYSEACPFNCRLGRLSDRFDRRILAAVVAACLCLTSLALALIQLPKPEKFIVTFMLGGFLTAIYPLCVAHANDRAGPEKVVAASGQLILINGFASFLGPILGVKIMGRFGLKCVLIYIAAVRAYSICCCSRRPSW